MEITKEQAIALIKNLSSNDLDKGCQYEAIETLYEVGYPSDIDPKGCRRWINVFTTVSVTNHLKKVRLSYQ